jgi:hypothetical protein
VVKTFHAQHRIADHGAGHRQRRGGEWLGAIQFARWWEQVAGELQCIHQLEAFDDKVAGGRVYDPHQFRHSAQPCFDRMWVSLRL